MIRQLDLSSLAVGMPGLTPALGTVMAEASSVCLDGEGHARVLNLRVDGDFEEEFVLQRLEVDEQMVSSYQFATTATERGACGIAILAVGEITSYTVLQEARRGTHFDYYLGPRDGFLFQGAARLEVSGLRRADEAAIRERVRAKLKRMGRLGEHLPGFVAVVEFSRPLVRIVRR
jgi:hypothetical protein